MKYVLFYESNPDGLAQVPKHIEAHRALWQQFRTAGTLLLIGPFADPPAGAMGIFTTREAAEEMVRADPFVTFGVVAHWTIREWKEALTP